MDKTKINIMYGANPVENRRERSFSTECRNAFGYLLASDDLDKEETFYQGDKTAKDKMDEFLEYYAPGKIAFVGVVGSGKTAFLHQYFNLDANNGYCLKDHALYFYHSDKGNGVIEAGRDMESLKYELRSLCAYIENVRNLSLDRKNCRAFYEFVVRTKKEVLGNPWLRDADETVYCEAVKELRDNRELSFSLMKLKYYLLHDMKDITKVVFIFDDIRDSDSYLKLNKRICQCMCNYDSDVYAGYQVKAVYAMSEEVYWSVNGTGTGERFDAVINKERMMDTDKLFEVRRKKAEDKGGEWMRQKGFGEADLRFAYGQLMNLNKKFNGKYKTMILQISQYRKEDVMRCYRQICFNRVWIQKEVFCYSADSYQTNEGFLFTNITCIRALACGDNQVYENTDKSFGNLIPNILYNTPEEDLGIHCLLLMKYFVRNNPSESPGHESDVVAGLLKDIFGEECGMFQQALRYLIRKDVIAETGRCLRINSKGAELWDMLQGDSVLFELCREDYYRSVDTDYNMEPSYKLIDSMRQYVIFGDLLQMIKEFVREENRLYDIVTRRGKWAEYEQYFGKRRMTFYLFVGVTKSIEYSACRSNQWLDKLRNETEQIVNARYRES